MNTILLLQWLESFFFLCCCCVYVRDEEIFFFFVNNFNDSWHIQALSLRWNIKVSIDAKNEDKLSTRDMITITIFLCVYFFIILFLLKIDGKRKQLFVKNWELLHGASGISIIHCLTQFSYVCGMKFPCKYLLTSQHN